MKKFLIQIVLLIMVIGVGFFFFNPSAPTPTIPFLPQTTQFKELVINDKKLNVEIADTQAKKSKGLGGRQNLASDSGMLFIFSKPDKYPFWMKGLSFPLDFIYIKGDKIVDFIANVPPPIAGQKDADLPIYLPKVEVDQVLEVNGGIVEKLGIKVGDTIHLN